MESLKDKWALVTGSSRGIGQQVAMGLAQVNCNVIVHGRTPGSTAETLRLLERYPVEPFAIAGDLSTEDGVREVIDGARSAPAPIDILYNNAGVMNEWQPMWEVSRDTWLAVLQVNLLAMIALCNAFAPGMKERGYGRIINLTSGIAGTPHLAPYSVSKGAVDKYTQDLAAELRGSNVLANTLDPGWLKTDMGGPDADHEVSTVLPGAIVPALLDDGGPTGQRFAAQDYRSDG